jgi:hypothetical protein
LEAAQVAAQKKQEAELERLRTQLVFKQHEIEASRRTAPRAPAPSQFTGSTQPQRLDVPSTPRNHHVTASQNLFPLIPVAAPPRVSKGHPPLPGFVNAFVMPKNGKGKGPDSVPEQDQDLPLHPHGDPMKASTQAPPDEEMEIDKDEVGGQAANTTYSEADFHMDVADDLKTPQLNVGFSKTKTVEPFDWVGWVCPPFSLILARASNSSNR